MTGKYQRISLIFKTSRLTDNGDGINVSVEFHAAEYQLQMQCYSEAVRRMIPNISEVKATLQFLQPIPSLEYEYPSSMISEASSNQQIQAVMNRIGRCGSDPVSFAASTGKQCLRCTFHDLCPEGSAYLSNKT